MPEQRLFDANAPIEIHMGKSPVLLQRPLPPPEQIPNGFHDDTVWQLRRHCAASPTKMVGQPSLGGELHELAGSICLAGIQEFAVAINCWPPTLQILRIPKNRCDFVRGGFDAP